jgi:hypothetical protein
MVYLALRSYVLLDHYFLASITGEVLRMHLQLKVSRCTPRKSSRERYTDGLLTMCSSVSPSGSVEARAAKLAEVIEQKCKGKSVNIIA